MKLTLSNEALHTWAFGQLSLAQHHFAMNPCASHWNETIKAMFIYQQTHYAIHSKTIDTPALLSKLAPMNRNTWGDLISMTTVGMTVLDAQDSFNSVNA
jgi:hypothetical protein